MYTHMNVFTACSSLKSTFFHCTSLCAGIMCQTVYLQVYTYIYMYIHTHKCQTTISTCTTYICIIANSTYCTLCMIRQSSWCR